MTVPRQCSRVLPVPASGLCFTTLATGTSTITCCGARKALAVGGNPS